MTDRFPGTVFLNSTKFSEITRSSFSDEAGKPSDPEQSTHAEFLLSLLITNPFLIHIIQESIHFLFLRCLRVCVIIVMICDWSKENRVTALYFLNLCCK